MPIFVGVIFKEAGKVYYFDPNDLDLKVGDHVIVKTRKGTEYAEVVTPPAEINEEDLNAPLKKVLRQATKKDIERVEKNKKEEKRAFNICEKKVIEYKLPMKIIDVEVVFDRTKYIFYFTSEGRVDFRDLVKELARIFKARIELRQIGVRDEAKMVGGLGPCGGRLCCTLFLGEFEPVSIKMAKIQDLPLNPMKISGICGRLMCCLKYEFNIYSDFKDRAPKIGTKFEMPEGIGEVVEHDVPQESVILEFPEARRIKFKLHQLPGYERKCCCQQEKCSFASSCSE